MSSSEYKERRRIFVGDIQGCRVELEELVERVRFDPARDVLHPVGDFVNRGPDSTGVLRVCRALGAGGVLGNHDVHALRIAGGLRARGKRDTLDELFAADDRHELLAWLAARPFVLGFEDVLCVHAAIDPSWKDPLRELVELDPLREEPALSFAVAARYCDEQGRRPAADWPPPPPPFRPWYEFWPRAGEARTVVFGHWARNGLVVLPKVRGLDTGCVWGGQLTAWIPDEDRIVQVDARRSYAAHD